MTRSPATTTTRQACVLGLACALAAAAPAADVPPAAPTSAVRLAAFGTGGTPAAPWRVALLPGQKKPATQFSVEARDGVEALRVEAQASYGNLVHELPAVAPPHGLSWRWRVDHLVEGADLRNKKGDDVPLKVCALFDLPLARVPFFERQLLRLARQRAGESLPAATVCYVWDNKLPPGTQLPNAYTQRLRMIVLRSGRDELGLWQAEHRDLAADFLKLFGDETQEVPPLVAIAVGADADNTGGSSLGWVAELRLD